MFDEIKRKGFQVEALHHAEAILLHDMKSAVDELEEALLTIEIPLEELVRGGGGEGQMTQRLRKKLSESLGWKKHNFEIKKVVDGQERESTSHEIDHVKGFPAGTFALEIEWNNKDPFFDRDLENFKRLHADGVISIGAIVTRGDSLQDSLRALIEDYAIQHRISSVDCLPDFLDPTQRQRRLYEKAAVSRGSFEAGWAHEFVSDKFGKATTHWRKLMDRIDRGVGNPCPLLLIGIPKSVVKT
ncbi:MAG: BglII/BstYI family type II restriction endonuclease [Planctomycetota bacterium]